MKPIIKCPTKTILFFFIPFVYFSQLGWRPSLVGWRPLLLVTRMLPGTKGIATRSKKLLVAPGITTRNKKLLGWRPSLLLWLCGLVALCDAPGDFCTISLD